MKNKLLQIVAAFLTLFPLAYSQTKTKTQKIKILELNNKVLRIANELNIDVLQENLKKEDVDAIIEQLKLEGIDIKKVDMKESLLGTQGVTD